MRWQKYISSELGIKNVPSGFQKIGDVAILNLPKELIPRKREIGELTLKFSKKIKTVCLNKGPIKGELREPNIEIIAGDGTETIHKENGCKFFLDVKKVMFSKGNLKERARMKKVTKGVVLDMFAGIGYFSIPAALNRKVEKVYSIEKNPESFKFLKKNIQLNNVNIIPYWGDCRQIIKNNNFRVDQVIMGLLPNPIDFLQYALASLKEKGVIYYHTTQDIDKELDFSKIERIIKKRGYSVSEIKRIVIKKYGPRVNHIVLDLHITS